MSEDLTKYETTNWAVMEKVIALGDLSKLGPQDRMAYYKAVCDSLGLNPLTTPFGFISTKNGVKFYANKGCTDQLRDKRGVTFEKPDIQFQDDIVYVTITAIDRTGRRDTDVGAVSLVNLKGEERANAVMKAMTKAKRRVTLSLCGLGWADDSEVDTIPDAHRISLDMDTGETERAPLPSDPDERKRTFFADVLDQIPYYQHRNHIVNTLKGLGFGSYDQTKEVEMFAALQRHANEKANEKAAQNKPPTLDEELEAAQAAGQKESPL